MIAILIFFYLNRSQINHEDFSNKKKTKKIKKIIKKIRLPQQPKILPPQNIVLDESRNKEYTNA